MDFEEFLRSPLNSQPYCVWYFPTMWNPLVCFDSVLMLLPYHWYKQSISSVQFSRSVVSNSLWPHESQHTRPPCPSSTPRVHSNSHPSSRLMPSSHLILCHPLLLLPPIPPSIRVFSNNSTLQMRWLKYWSFSFSISPSKDWFPLEWTG